MPLAKPDLQGIEIREVENEGPNLPVSYAASQFSSAPYSPFSQKFKIAVICAILGFACMLISSFAADWVSVTIQFQGQTYQAFKAGLWYYCFTLSRDVVALDDIQVGSCRGLTFWTEGLQVFQTRTEGVYPQMTTICFVMAIASILAGIYPLYESTQTKGYEHYWAGAFFLATCVYNIVGISFYVVGTSRHIVATHLNQAEGVRTRFQWGLWLFVVGTVLFLVSGFLLITQASVYMRRGRDSRGFSIFSNQTYQMFRASMSSRRRISIPPDVQMKQYDSDTVLKLKRSQSGLSAVGSKQSLRKDLETSEL